MVYEFNNLDNKLLLWYHSNTDINWTLDSYKNIASLSTIEDYWLYTNKLNNIYINNCMFFLMKEGITPLWEDESNINGGCISIKLQLPDAYELWCSLSKYLAANILDEKINGISISPKKTFNIIKIWMREEIDMMSYKLPSEFKLNNKIVLFRVHKKNIEKDKLKIN
jgi:hypothetical protein